MVNAQEYSQIIDQPFMPENIWDSGNFYPQGEVVNNGGTYYTANKNVPPGTDITNTEYWTVITNPDTVGDKQTTRPKDLQINDAILTQAYEDVPLSGYDNVKFYILPTGPNGEPGSAGLTADDTYPTADGTQTGEGITPNGFGYAQGYNEALKTVDADIFALVNSDVEVTQNWLQPIIETFKKDTRHEKQWSSLKNWCV
jgi:hypothetical protein